MPTASASCSTSCSPPWEIRLRSTLCPHVRAVPGFPGSFFRRDLAVQQRVDRANDLPIGARRLLWVIGPGQDANRFVFRDHGEKQILVPDPLSANQTLRGDAKPLPFPTRRLPLALRRAALVQD